jgi:hypothetical protein
MKLEERKKDIAEKLRYLGSEDEAIKIIISTNYSPSAIKEGKDTRLEKLVNHHYQEIRETREETNKIRIKLMTNKYNLEEISYN